MKKQHILTVLAIFTIIVLACQKGDTPLPDENKPKDIYAKIDMMRNHFWSEYRPDTVDFPPLMKFRFYGDSSVNYIFLSDWWEPYKYDSNANAVWRLIPPDTIRFFGHSGGDFSFGQIRLLANTDSIMTTNIPGYGDTTDFVREY